MQFAIKRQALLSCWVTRYIWRNLLSFKGFWWRQNVEIVKFIYLRKSFLSQSFVHFTCQVAVHMLGPTCVKECVCVYERESVCVCARCYFSVLVSTLESNITEDKKFNFCFNIQLVFDRSCCIYRTLVSRYKDKRLE